MRNRTFWALAFVGVILAINSASTSVKAADLFNNTNASTPSDCQQPLANCSPTFTLPPPTTPPSTATTDIDEIQTYHRQVGSTLNAIMLRATSTGTILGVFAATPQPAASTGFVNWIAPVGLKGLPPGTYEVIDLQSDTWQQNVQSGNKGFTIVRGITGGTPTGGITDCTATCTNVPAGRPIYACSAHGPDSRCLAAPGSADFPGGGVTCTDGKNVTTCSCQNGCSTR
jgi:hypothetical protein